MLKHYGANEDVKIFCSIGLNFLRRCLNIPLSLSEQSRLTEGGHFGKIEIRLKQHSRNSLRLGTIDLFQQLENIINRIKSVTEPLHNQHPKYDFFVRTVRKMGIKDRIVLKKPFEASIVQKFLDENLIEATAVSLKQLIKDDKVYEKILYTGYFGISQLIPNIKLSSFQELYILTGFERERLEEDLKKITFRIGMEKQSGIEDFTSGVSVSTEENVSGKRNLKEPELFLNSINWDREIVKYHTDSSSEEKETVLVHFDEDMFALFTDGYRCHVLNHKSQEVVPKYVHEIKPGDELAFIDNTDDLFDEIVERIKEKDEEITVHYRLSSLWKKALIKFQHKHGYSIKSLKNLLKEHKVNRNEATIENWLKNDNVIAPDRNVIEAIADLTNDPELSSKLVKVIDSASRIKSLHIQVGRYVSKAIMSSFKGEDDFDYPLLKELSEELSERTTVYRVLSVSDKKYSVPSNQVNKLIFNELGELF